ncbi:MAG TPA: hypothetical protein VGZ89_08925 [Xanthobacteraceae bacterium]|nr:hypothetical protein [Xanthobacteraceae bacterium]
MYIPIAQIPSCRSPFKNDNPYDGNPYEEYCDYEAETEPGETVTIHLSSLPTHEAVAEFYSYLAYPDPTEATQRKKYSIALSRWAVLERGKLEKDWNESPDTGIRPAIFSQPEQLFLKTYRLGTRRWWRRAQCAFMMLLPDLVHELFSGLPYTVGNAALMAADQFGYSMGSQKTVESRIWAPTKPVAHAAAAVMLCLGVLDDPEQEWDDTHSLCNKQRFLATLFYEDVFKNLVLLPAENLRFQMPGCERFQIKGKDTIRFIAD